MATRKTTGNKMPETNDTPDEKGQSLPSAPKRGEAGQYLPSRYTTPNGNVRRDC